MSIFSVQKEKTVDTITSALFDSDLVLLRILLGVAEFFWFVLLIWPGTVFDQPYYIEIREIMSEETLAFVFLGISIFQFYIIATDRYHTTIASFFAFISAMIWAIMILTIFFSVTPPPAQISGEIALTLGALWVWLRPIILYHGIQSARKKSGP
jgi:hypothetical protein